MIAHFLRPHAKPHQGYGDAILGAQDEISSSLGSCRLTFDPSDAALSPAAAPSGPYCADEVLTEIATSPVQARSVTTPKAPNPLPARTSPTAASFHPQTRQARAELARFC